MKKCPNTWMQLCVCVCVYPESIPCYSYVHAFRTNCLVFDNLWRRRPIFPLLVAIVYFSLSQSGAMFSQCSKSTSVRQLMLRLCWSCLDDCVVDCIGVASLSYTDDRHYLQQIALSAYKEHQLGLAIGEICPRLCYFGSREWVLVCLRSSIQIWAMFGLQEQPCCCKNHTRVFTECKLDVATKLSKLLPRNHRSFYLNVNKTYLFLQQSLSNLRFFSEP